MCCRSCGIRIPSGYRVRMEKQLGGTVWRLVGTRAKALLCHKPCTVSGGGKSEISKSIANAIQFVGLSDVSFLVVGLLAAKLADRQTRSDVQLAAATRSLADLRALRESRG